MTPDHWRLLAVCVAVIIFAAIGNFWKTSTGEPDNRFQRDHFRIWFTLNLLASLIFAGAIISASWHPTR